MGRNIPLSISQAPVRQPSFIGHLCFDPVLLKFVLHYKNVQCIHECGVRTTEGDVMANQ